MDSYIVRVYRSGNDETGEEITGLVEEVGFIAEKSVPDPVRVDYNDSAACRTERGGSDLHTRDSIR